MKRKITPEILLVNLKKGIFAVSIFLLASNVWAQPVCNPHFLHYSLAGDPDSVHFYIDSSNVTFSSYYWSFGDGTSSTVQNPWHLYHGTGPFYACLYVTDSTANGVCTGYWCDTIVIGNPSPPSPSCHAHFIHYSLINNPDSVHFYIDSVNAPGTTYQWYFGDGTSSTLLNPWHLYNGTGPFYPCLYVRDSTASGVCTAHWCDTIVIGNPPPPVCNAHFVHYSLNGNPDSVHFYIDSSNVTFSSYYWSFGDGTSSTVQNPWHLYHGTGPFYACLYVTDSTANGVCTGYWCDTIVIGNPPPPPPPTCHVHFIHYSLAGNPDSFHFYIDSSNVTFSSYYWSFGDGTSSTLQNPWHLYHGTGPFYACLYVTDSTANGVCTGYWCDTIVIGNPPPPPPPACHVHFIHYSLAGDPDSVHFYIDSSNVTFSSYYWSFGDGTSSTVQNPWHLYHGTGPFYACLYVTDSTANGVCTGYWCDTIVIGNSPPPPVCNAHFGHYTMNNPDSIHFYPPANASNSHYQWTFSDSTSSSLQYPWHYFTAPGIYTVCLTVTDTTSNGVCMDHWCDTVQIGNPLPNICNAVFTSIVSSHNTDSVQFHSSPNPAGTHYLWTFDDGSYSTNADPWHFFNTPGIYNVCLTVWDSTAAGSCGDTWCDSIHVAVPRPPNFVTIYPNPASQQASVTLTNMESSVTFSIFDPIGNLVYKKENLSDGDFNIGIAGLVPGIYYYRVDNGSQILTNGKLVIVQ